MRRAGARSCVRGQRFREQVVPARRRRTRRAPAVAPDRVRGERAGRQEEAVAQAVRDAGTEEDHPAPAGLGVVVQLQRAQLACRARERL